MKVSDIFMAGIFFSVLISIYFFLFTVTGSYAPTTTANYTNAINNISGTNLTQPNGAMLQEAQFLNEKLQNLSTTGLGTDFLTQLTTAFGLSVFFGIEAIRSFFIALVSLPLGIVTFFNVMIISMIGNNVLSQTLVLFTPYVTIIIMSVIVITIFRLFKGDI